MAAPKTEIKPAETQAFGALKSVPLGLDDNARSASVASLNQILADTMAIRDLYKKHHWQVSGATFYSLHLLLDKHFNEQAAMVDSLAERIMTLGGISVATAHDVAEMSKVPRPPQGREDAQTQIKRLLEAHEIILTYAREAAANAGDAGDEGTNDLLISEVVRTGEMQVWFLAEHLA